MISTPTSVIAETNNDSSYREGAADEELLPGQGAYLSEDAAGEAVVHKAGANEATARAVREQRNPPRSLGNTGESPLDEAYNAGDNTETVGPVSNDKLRLRLSEHASADPSGNEAGWDVDGNLTDSEGTVDGADPLETTVYRIVRVIDRGTDDDFVVAEVL